MILTTYFITESKTSLVEIYVGKMLNVLSLSEPNGIMDQLTKKFIETVGTLRHFVPEQASKYTWRLKQTELNKSKNMGRRLPKKFFSFCKDKFCPDLTYLLRYDILQQYVTYLLRYDILQQHVTYLLRYHILQQYVTYLLQYDILQQHVTYLLRYDISLQYVTYLLRYDILQQCVTYLPHEETVGALRVLFVC